MMLALQIIGAAVVLVTVHRFWRIHKQCHAWRDTITSKPDRTCTRNYTP